MQTRFNELNPKPMRFIISLALLCTAALGVSQESKPKIHFRTLALGLGKFPELWVIDSEKPVAVPFSITKPSLPLQGDKTSPLQIFKGPLGDKGFPADPKPLLVPLPSTSSILLLGWMEGDKTGLLAIDDPFATMKNDDWMVINPTQSEIAVQIGEKAAPIAIKGNSNKAIKIMAKAGEGAAVTIAAKQADGSWKSIYSSFWPIYDNVRGLIVVTQKPDKRFNVNYIRDEIAKGAAAKP
jgi:hypothetical protein